MISAKEQLKIIMKGVTHIVSEEDLLSKLENSNQTGKPLVIKLGLDPSAPDIHLGHTVVLRKIKQMQDLGHHAVIIIGDFTGRIGDPTGKSKTRKALSSQEVLKNAKTYEHQIFKVLDKDKTDLKFNSDWLSKLNFEDIIKLAGNVTVARILERDDFKKRFKSNEPIGLHEFFYPLMQSYDSIHIHADIEMGGLDQTFNIMMGRTLQKAYCQESQIALFMPLLEGIDGKEKMSKSLGNYIGIFEEAAIMFQKVMTIPDNLILKYFELVTDVHPDEIGKIRMELDDTKVNPRDIKLRLAREITNLYWGKKETQEAEDYFKTVYQKKLIPDEMPEILLPNNCMTHKGKIDLIKLIVECQMAQSNSDARRLITQSAVKINSAKQCDFTIPCTNDDFVLQVGKGKFIKVRIR